MLKHNFKKSKICKGGYVEPFKYGLHEIDMNPNNHNRRNSRGSSKKNKNNSWYVISIIILALICVSVFFFFKNRLSSDNSGSYTAQKSSSSQNSTQDDNKNNSKENQETSNSSEEQPKNQSNTQGNENNEQSQSEQQPQQTQPETQIATFTTKIYTKDDSRQNNMNITASRLNGHIIKNGETFSFCKTLGPSSSKNGYKEADIFDNEGNKKKGLGGGNCQISSTLYNAVLAAPSLTVVERHEHSNNVPYVAKGKDAAVAYGSYDFKFRNDTGNDIKLIFQVTSNNVTVNIMKIG